MGLGIFGKLPQKRDFISFGIAQNALVPLENWLQSGIAASRAELGREWEERYLVAPIWRFWLGADILGTGAAGAIMPSVDGVGRYFPLMLVFFCGNGEQLPPPPFAPQGDWYGAIEARLLGLLHDDAALTVEASITNLPLPSLENAPGSTDLERFKGGAMWRAPLQSNAATLLTGILDADYREAARVRSFWWTAGSETAGPVLYTKEGLPDPYFYTRMLKSVAD